MVVSKFNADDGLYELQPAGERASTSAIGPTSPKASPSMPASPATTKAGWNAKSTSIRGFIPAGQISIYRVENFEEFVGQTWACVVVEANRDRRNLVLSRRGVLEREQAEAKKKLLAKAQPGEMREGMVRNDSRLRRVRRSGRRRRHDPRQPDELGPRQAPERSAEVGQKVKVKIQRSIPTRTRSAWPIATCLKARGQTPRRSILSTTTSPAPFRRSWISAAFVKLEPGIEGLVHISELSHKRVFRVSDVVKEGQEIEAKILVGRVENQRISLR